MAALRVGPGTSPDTQLGPMITERAVDGIAEKVDESVAAGAVAAIGGSRLDRPGFYYPATVLTDVPRESPVATEEIFGPVVLVARFHGEDEAVAVANDTPFGLSGSIWTRDIGRALRVARAVRSGALSVNSNSSVRYSTPFGGFKQSGIGRELGPDAMLGFSEEKNASAGYFPVSKPGVVQHDSIEPLEIASKHSSGGMSAPGSKNLISNLPPDMRSMSFEKRRPDGPRCGSWLPNALGIFHLTRS